MYFHFAHNMSKMEIQQLTTLHPTNRLLDVLMKKIMKFNDFGRVNKADRRGILAILVSLVFLSSIFGYITFGTNDNMDTDEYNDTPELTHTNTPNSQTKKNEEEYATVETAALFVFDPNTATKEQLLKLGLRDWQVRNILKYRAKGGTYSSPEDFAYVYGLTVKDYKRLKPYIHIGDDYKPASTLSEVRNHRNSYRQFDNTKSDQNIANNTTDVKRFSPKIKKGEHIQVNEADTTRLMKIPGIGSYFARQIVRYGKQLGGYVNKNQLLEIENFPQDAIQYIVIDEKLIHKLNVNKLSISQLKRHPYINYYQAKAITDYRRLKGSIKNINELQLLEEFSDRDINRISPYIEY